MIKDQTRYIGETDDGLSITVCEDRNSAFYKKIQVEHIGGYHTLQGQVEYYEMVLEELKKFTAQIGK